jgi:hypothetical protein
MKRGHCRGTKRERPPRQSTRERYRQMGDAIAQKLATKTQQELLHMPIK